MQGNDLDNRPTHRYLVAAEAVLNKTETKSVKRQLFRTSEQVIVSYSVDAAAMSQLWEFSQRMGVRLEVFFAGELAVSATELWESIDTWTNPFSDWLIYESLDKVIHDIAYRPDVLGYIDIPSRSAMYGGKGLTIASLR